MQQEEERGGTHTAHAIHHEPGQQVLQDVGQDEGGHGGPPNVLAVQVALHGEIEEHARHAKHAPPRKLSCIVGHTGGLAHEAEKPGEGNLQHATVAESQFHRDTLGMPQGAP